MSGALMRARRREAGERERTESSESPQRTARGGDFSLTGFAPLLVASLPAWANSWSTSGTDHSFPTVGVNIGSRLLRTASNILASHRKAITKTNQPRLSWAQLGSAV
jgi:hypothetical protein